MCEPTTIALASLAIGSANAIAQTSAQRKASNQQNENLRLQQAVEGQQRAVQSTQFASQAAQQQAEIDRIARKEQAELSVIATETGATGNVLDRALNVSKSQASQAKTQEYLNTVNTLADMTQQGQLSASNASRSMTKGPSWLGTALQIGGMAASTAATKLGQNSETGEIFTVGDDVKAKFKKFKG